MFNTQNIPNNYYKNPLPEKRSKESLYIKRDNYPVKLTINTEDEIYEHSKYIPRIERHKKLMPQPNTQRTLIPSLRTEEDIKKDNSKYHKFSKQNNKSSGLLNPNSFNPLISYDNNKKERRELKSSQSNRNNFKLSYDDNEMNLEYKREKGKPKYEEYKTTTQIYSLPGGVKRKINEKSINPLYKESIDKKLENDYQSKIICLPNTETRDINNENKFECKRKFRINRNKENIDDNYYLKTEENSFRKGKRSFRNLQNVENKIMYPGITDQFKSHFILG